ncbi:sodium/potassium/calcium exchanger 5-like [Dermacentor andersoni]|uniref:sodium/potassium/calcium exchanger 5-like n=1 Tax=Dermacentor andersoni TaxID=34620 RepID=UPI0021550C95|nr:sodium/potassium/calcium exchanger 5-like [Dermacentor andersoni]
MGHGRRCRSMLWVSGVLGGRWSFCLLTTALLAHTEHATARRPQNHSDLAVGDELQSFQYNGKPAGSLSNATVTVPYEDADMLLRPQPSQEEEEGAGNASSSFSWQHQQQLAAALLTLPCVPPSIDEFPRDPFTQEQRLQGWLAVHFLVLAYLCCMLAIVCDEYFVPCLERLSGALKISSDVAGATVMAVGTSSPELYSAIIGSFVTEGDIGVGTIVGSAVFNILGVTSVTGIYLLYTTVQLEWYPIVRDCLLYVASVSVLAACISDSIVHWYEAVSLLLLFGVYILVMHYNPQLKSLAIAQVDEFVAYIKSEKPAGPRPKKSKSAAAPAEAASAPAVSEVAAPLLSSANHVSHSPLEPAAAVSVVKPRSGSQARVGVATEKGYHDDVSGGAHPLMGPDRRAQDVAVEMNGETKVSFARPSAPSEAGSSTDKSGRRGCPSRTWWLVTLPASLLLRVTVPDCRRWPRLFPLTFIMAVVWIGLLSYLCAWMVTVIGYTLNIPDSVSGITILAAGISVPEIITTVLIVKMGFGNMAFSNLIGSNIFDILFCLGLPWLVKTLSNSGGRLRINSGALTYTTLTLLATTVLMLVTLCAARWRLNWRVGLVCLGLYVAFLTLACCYELNYFGPFNPPTCR